MLRKQAIGLLLAASLCSACANKKESAIINPTTLKLQHQAALARDFETTVGGKVLFNFDSSKLTNNAKKQLKKQLAWLSKHSDINVLVEGHCDERGKSEYNLALGHRRASEIRKFLLEHGIESDRVNTISYGKELPEVLGHNKKAWSKNRRGLTFITIKAAE